MLWDDQVREWKEEAREEGFSEGREEGREIGLAEGRAEGREEGERLGRVVGIAEGANDKAVETAENLIKMGLGTPEQIAAATKLSIEKVLEIKQGLE